jgi:hypothetical protein
MLEGLISVLGGLTRDDAPRRHAAGRTSVHHT